MRPVRAYGMGARLTCGREEWFSAAMRGDHERAPSAFVRKLL